MFKQAHIGPQWDAIILGAGVVGLGTAWALKKAGVNRVLVLERHVVAGGASSRGTGSVHVQRWTETDVRLIQRSQALMADIAQEVGPAFQFNRVGRLTLVPHEDVERMQGFVEMFRHCGVDVEMLSTAQLMKLIPGIETADVGVAAYTRQDGCVYPGGLTWSLAGLLRQAGGLVMEGVDVRSICLEGATARGVYVGFPEPVLLEAPIVVVAAGAWSGLLLGHSGLKLPIQQIRTSTVVAMVTDAAGCEPIPSFLDAVQGGFSYIPRNPGTLVLAGGASDDPVAAGDEQLDPTPPPYTEQRRAEVFEALNRCALHRFPGWTFGPVLGGWSGMLDTTPDAHPIAGEYPGVSGLHLACGLSGYGVMRGIALGEAVALRALGKEPPASIAAFDPGRFGNPQSSFKVDWGGYNPFSSLEDVA